MTQERPGIEPQLAMAISKIWSQEEAASKIHDLEQKNRSLVAKIMKLQGETDQVTDVDIQVRFNKLYDAIRTWIQNVQRDLRQKGWSFKDIFQQEVQDDPSTLSRMGILLHEDDEQDPGLAIWDDNRLDIRWAWWLGKHTTCIYVVLSIMIWRYLEEGIFHHPFPIGVPKSARNMFGEIIKSMKMTDDGEVLANKWRSETITTITNSNMLRNDREKQLDILIGELGSSLEKFLEQFFKDTPDLWSTHRESLEHTVIRFAADLHQDMTCSPSEYIREGPTFRRGEIPNDIELTHWNLKDITNWLPVTKEDGIIRVFNCLFPGVFRLGTGNEDRVEVVKPVVLVYDGSSPKQSRQQKSGPSRPSKPPRSYSLNSLRKLDFDVNPARSGSKSTSRAGPSSSISLRSKSTSCSPNHHHDRSWRSKRNPASESTYPE